MEKENGFDKLLQKGVDSRFRFALHEFHALSDKLRKNRLKV